MFAKIRNFFVEVAVELKKVSWSTRQELVYSTMIVIVSSAMLGVFISTTDFVLAKILALLIK